MVAITRRGISVSGAALLSGCLTPREAPTPIPSPPPHAAIGAWGVDLAARDMTIKPGDDFFRHVNGAWMAANQIPPDRVTWGTNDILADKAERDVREIIQAAARSGGAPGSNAQKISDFYNAFGDQAAIDALALAPIQPALAEIEALRSHEDVIRFIARPDVGLSSPIDLSVQLDEGNPDRYLPNLSHGGLGLPEREYYRRADAQFPALRAAYAAKIEEMLALVGQGGGHAKAQAILALDRKSVV
jgi:putative endopeptidase